MRVLVLVPTVADTSATPPIGDPELWSAGFPTGLRRTDSTPRTDPDARKAFSFQDISTPTELISYIAQ
ncbi:hypothetical protein ACWGKW_35200 [Streptomyces sp. NPDC054766]